MLRRCPLRRPHDASTAEMLLMRSPTIARETAQSTRRFTSASSAVMQSMEELIDHAALGKRQEQATTTDKYAVVDALPFVCHTNGRLRDYAFVHPTAVVDPRASLGHNVRVGPYSIVGADVVLEDGVVLQSHVVVDGKTRVGSDTVVHPFACIGGVPQDKKHDRSVLPSSSFQLEIGRNCVIREHVTIHGSTSYSAQTPTSLGDNCWILCGAHVGHDVQIGSHVVLSNNVCVAGHVEIGNFAIIGGQVGLKQHIKIGSLAMIGGGSAVDGDVLPYGLASGNRAKLLGLNLIGLRRAKISRHQIKLMLRVVRYLFGSSLTDIAAVCPKTGFAPALDLPYHDSVLLRAFEAKRYLTDIEITTTSNPFVHEITHTEIRIFGVVRLFMAPFSLVCFFVGFRMAKYEEAARPQRREKHAKRKDHRTSKTAKSGDDQPEAATLLSPPRLQAAEGHANAEPEAATTSSLLVRRPEDERESGKRKTKHKSRLNPATAKSLRQGAEPTAKTVKNQAESADETTPRDQGQQRQRQHGTTARVALPSFCGASTAVWKLFASSICGGGSLRLPVSTTQLAPLSATAQATLESLDAVTTKSHIEMCVRHTDNMPFASSSGSSSGSGSGSGSGGRPVVVMHLVDLCSGRPLETPHTSPPATITTRSLNSLEWNASHTWTSTSLHEFLSPRVLVLLEILEPRRLKKVPPPTRKDDKSKNKNSVGGVRGTKNSGHEDRDLKNPAHFKRLAWCFFKPVSGSGNIRLPSIALADIQPIKKDTALRLQLFTWQSMSWFDLNQARTQFQYSPSSSSSEGVPAVFLQYQKRTRVPVPCSVHVDIRPVPAAPVVLTPRRLSGIKEQASDRSLVDDGDNQAPPPDELSHDTHSGNQDQEPIHQDASPLPSMVHDPLLKYKRQIGEPCLVPQRVLHRLPTGRRGCSCVAFSPDGLFLAAAVHHVSATTEEWVVHIHQVNTGVLWQSCRGHQNIIYSLEWGLLKDTTTKVLVSASSDGSAIVWLLKQETAVLAPQGSSSVMLPYVVYQHVPAPVFVYCAIFHTTQPHCLLTGASDGVVRLWDIRTATQSSVLTTSKLGEAYSSSPLHQWKATSGSGGSGDDAVAIHCMRMESKPNGRLFCGDASGTITVWTPSSATEITERATRFELTKTVRTGQRSVTSLYLHPRKQHLLVLTHPYALLQYELRSFLLLHKNYTGVECDELLVKAAFSPDGQFVVSGSEDGVPHLFGSLNGQRLDGASKGVWGQRFFHGSPLLEIAWSPSSHIVAMAAYGENHPIVMLCAHKDDWMPGMDDSGSGFRKPMANSSRDLLRKHATGTQHVRDSSAHSLDAAAAADSRHHRIPEKLSEANGVVSDRLQRSLQRRQQRLEAKLAREIEKVESSAVV